MLEGALVRLRPIDASDAQRAVAWFNDPEVTYWLMERYGRAADSVPWLVDTSMTDFASGVRFAVDTKDGEHVGAVNLHRINPEDRKAALGIVLGAKAQWGRGYGGDAVNTLVRFAFDDMNLNRVWLTVTAGHERAIACYKRCGFIEEAREREAFYKHGKFWDFLVMGILRRNFDALHRRTAREGGNHA